MRRPPRPVQIPKVPEPLHERRAALRMVLVAGAISALILSGNMKAQAQIGDLPSSAVPLSLQVWTTSGGQSCTESWQAVESPLQDCLYQWWLMEPQHGEVHLEWRSGALGGSTLAISDLPPPAVQACLQDAMGAATPQGACALSRHLSLPPGE